MSLINKLVCAFYLLAGILITGCKRGPHTYPSPPGYQLSRPVKVDLRTELDEISGLQFYPKDTSVFAIIDEGGSLYKIQLKKNITVQKWKFSKKEDYEDLVLLDSTFYLLESKGTIRAFKYYTEDSILRKKYKLPFRGDNEFESLYYDTSRQVLVLLCKDCEEDKKETLTAYGFNPSTRSFLDTPVFVMDVNALAQKLGLNKMKFKPSAAAVSPVDHKLYIISAINKALAVTDLNGKVEAAYPLRPGLFKQPEGMTFTPNGDLLISNESADLGPANILVYKYKARKK